MVPATVVLMTSCAQSRARTKQREPRVAPAVVPRLIGTVALVNEEGGFVLVDSGAHATPQPGTALKTFTGEVESGVLAAGDVRRRPFVIADIVRGEPKRGDRVFQ